MARVGVKPNTVRATLLQPCLRLLSESNPLEPSTQETAGAPWRLGRPDRFFDYVLKKAVEYSDSVGPEPLKPRTDRHESDT